MKKLFTIVVLGPIAAFGIAVHYLVCGKDATRKMLAKSVENARAKCQK